MNPTLQTLQATGLWTAQEVAYADLQDQMRSFLKEQCPDLSELEMEARLLRCSQILLTPVEVTA